MNSVDDFAREAAQLLLAFARNVRSARKRLGLTREELAQRSGVTQAVLVLIERGTADPDLHMIAALAKALECEVAVLCRGQSNNRKRQPRKPNTRAT